MDYYTLTIHIYINISYACLGRLWSLVSSNLRLLPFPRPYITHLTYVLTDVVLTFFAWQASYPSQYSLNHVMAANYRYYLVRHYTVKPEYLTST